MNKIKKIQNQGYLFLKDIKTLESALQLVSDSQLIVSVYLTENRYHLIICDRKERSEFESYIAPDLSYSEIPIPSSCEQITGIYARVKFEVDNLIGRLIDLLDTEAIVESGYNLNVYRIAEKSAIKPFFIISLSGAEFDIAPEERVRELLELEVTLNRGYALSAWYGLTKYDLTKEQLQKEINTKYWEGYQDDSNHYN